MERITKDDINVDELLADVKEADKQVIRREISEGFLIRMPIEKIKAYANKKFLNNWYLAYGPVYGGEKVVTAMCAARLALEEERATIEQIERLVDLKDDHGQPVDIHVVLTLCCINGLNLDNLSDEEILTLGFNINVTDEDILKKIPAEKIEEYKEKNCYAEFRRYVRDFNRSFHSVKPCLKFLLDDLKIMEQRYKWLINR